MKTLTYLGTEYPANSRVDFITSVRNTISTEDKEQANYGQEYRLKTLYDFYNNAKLVEAGFVELILPSYELQAIDSIKEYVDLNWHKYKDMVVLLYYPREIELAILPQLFCISKAIIARSNTGSNDGICVYSKDTAYVVGQTYTW